MSLFVLYSFKFRTKFEYEKNFVSSFAKQENSEIVFFRIALLKVTKNLTNLHKKFFESPPGCLNSEPHKRQEGNFGPQALPLPSPFWLVLS